MFPEDADPDILATHLAKAPGQRFCFNCLSQALKVSLDVIRRLAWQLVVTAVIQPGRCAACSRRGVTIQVPAAHAAALLSTSAERGSAGARARVGADASAPPDASERVLAVLNTGPGKAWCAACVALAAQLGLMEVRVSIAELSSRAAVSIDPDGACAFCLRYQTVVIA